MKIGIIPVNIGVDSVEQMTGLAQLAEGLGFESVWTFEHVIVPLDYQSKYPYSPTGKMGAAPETNFVDPLIALSHIAAATKTLKLGTGVNILPQANPLYLAKQAASLDFVSQGRLLLGLGIGWLREEFEALGVPFEKRGARFDDYLEAMQKLWQGGVADHQSEYLDWQGFKSFPSAPELAVVIGGNKGKAFDRVAKYGQGWFAPTTDAGELSADMEKLRAACDAHDRDASQVEITCMWTGQGGDEAVQALAAAGDRSIKELATHAGLVQHLRVIVPVLHDDNHLKVLLKWLAEHQLAAIVVDGAASEVTQRLVTTPHEYIAHPPGRGMQIACGVAASAVPWIWVLHADGLPSSAAVSQLGGLVEADEPRWGRFNVKIQGLALIAHTMNLRSRFSRICTGDQGMFFHAGLIQAIGGFPAQPLMEDIEVSRRLKAVASSAFVALSATVETSPRRWRQALAVFTRTPVMGKTKTRLAKSLGKAEALAAHIELVQGCLGRLQLQADARCELWVTDDAPIVAQWADRYHFDLRYQCEGDLGARMYHCLAQMFLADVSVAVLVGTDCPDIDGRYVRQAFRALQSNDVVFGPAEDGGYGLVGICHSAMPAAVTLFQDIAWGSSTVLAQSLERAAEAQLSVVQLPVIWDVDQVADWRRYQHIEKG
ncbi:unnamed protein product [Symbiodinium pilosum]|uniref:Luciferase-like domain-containing protein n=1 Tax=Symbiodinium pilosum TaxID=2952 RepID=A0A812S210_SYMPI|nr:unnamed protein product [Symbiodinium pilosum]